MLQNGVPRFGDFCRCTPCRQRRGKGLRQLACHAVQRDALRAGSAEAKWRIVIKEIRLYRCTPCRQRRGKGSPVPGMDTTRGTMHSVQAAPRQRPLDPTKHRTRQGCTPCRQRRGKGIPSYTVVPSRRGCTPCRQRRGKAGDEAFCIIACDDALRAGSAEAKTGYAVLGHCPFGRCTPCRQRRGKGASKKKGPPPDGHIDHRAAFFLSSPSRILTALPSSSVTMYNPVPIFLTDPAWRSRIFPTVPMLSVTGRLRGYAWCGESPWG